MILNFFAENKSNLGVYESFIDPKSVQSGTTAYVAVEDSTDSDYFAKLRQKEFFNYFELVEMQKRLRSLTNIGENWLFLLPKLFVSLEKSSDVRENEIVFWIITAFMQENKKLIYDFIDKIMDVCKENIMNLRSEKILTQILYLFICISENMKLELDVFYFDLLLQYLISNICTNEENCCLVLKVISMNVGYFEEDFLRNIAQNFLSFLNLNDISILSFILKILTNVFEIIDFELTDAEIHKITELCNLNTTIVVENSLDLLIGYSSKKENINNINIHQIFNIKLSIYPRIFHKILKLAFFLVKNSVFYGENVCQLINSKNIDSINFESKKIVLNILKICVEKNILKEINEKQFLFISSLILSDDNDVLLNCLYIMNTFKEVSPYIDENILENIEPLTNHPNDSISSISKLFLNYFSKNN